MLKLIDLIENNQHICEIEIDIRNEDGKRLKSYHIGATAQKDKFASWAGERWETIRVAINRIDVQRDYWQIYPKKIPKELLELQVTDWHSTTSYPSMVNGSIREKLYVTLLPNCQTLVITKPKQEAPEEVAKQMNIMDYL